MGVIAFALRRLRAAPRRWLPGAVGVAIAIGGFVIALTGPSLAGDVALRNEVRARPIESRTVSLVSLDTGAATDMRLDASVRSRMREQGLGEVLRETALRQIANADGTVYRLAGVDDLASGVAVISGRLPTTCTADHCEAVVWAREAITPTFTPDPALHLEIVGTVQRTDERILSGSFAPRDGELVVFVNGASAQDAIKALELFQRSTGWIAELKPEQLTVSPISLGPISTHASLSPRPTTSCKKSLPEFGYRRTGLPFLSVKLRPFLAASPCSPHWPYDSGTCGADGCCGCGVHQFATSASSARSSRASSWA
jgi:hypothetical protein